MNRHALFRPIALLAAAIGALVTPLAQAQFQVDQPLARLQPGQLTQQVGVLAMVNDKPITDVDLAYRINLDLFTSQQPNTNENRARIAATSLDSLIFDRIKVGEAEARGLDIGDAEVRTGLASIARRNNQTPSGFLEQLRQAGVPPNTFFDLVRSQIAWQALTGRSIERQARVTDSDVDAEINRINSLRGRREREMSEIFLPYTQYGGQQQAIAAAQDLIRQLESGASFGELAQRSSFAPTAGLGGRMGWVAEGTLAPEIERAIAPLFAGQITRTPIVARNGVYIIGIQRSRPIGSSSSQTLVRLLQLFRNIPDDRNGFEAQQDFLILNSATIETNNCREFETYINTYGDNGSGDMGLLDLSSLPPDLSQLVATLPEGRPSALVPVPNGGAVFMVCGRDERVDQLTRNQVAERLQAEREDTLTLRFERDLRRQAVVEYRF